MSHAFFFTNNNSNHISYQTPDVEIQNRPLSCLPLMIIWRLHKGALQLSTTQTLKWQQLQPLPRRHPPPVSHVPPVCQPAEPSDTLNPWHTASTRLAAKHWITTASTRQGSLDWYSHKCHFVRTSGGGPYRFKNHYCIKPASFSPPPYLSKIIRCAAKNDRSCQINVMQWMEEHISHELHLVFSKQAPASER